MPKRGRKSNIDPSIRRHVYLRESIVGPVELILANPLTGKPEFGALSSLMNELLAEWLAKQKKNNLTT